MATSADDGFGRILAQAVGDLFFVPAHELIHIVQHRAGQKDTSRVGMAAEHDASRPAVLLALRAVIEMVREEEAPHGLASVLCAMLGLKCMRLKRVMERAGAAPTASTTTPSAGATASTPSPSAPTSTPSPSPSPSALYTAWYNAFGVTDPHAALAACATAAARAGEADTTTAATATDADADAAESASLALAVRLESSFKWLAALDTAVGYAGSVPMLRLLELPAPLASTFTTPAAGTGSGATASAGGGAFSCEHCKALGEEEGGRMASPSSEPAAGLDSVLRRLLCVTFRGRSGVDVMSEASRAAIQAATAAHHIPSLVS